MIYNFKGKRFHRSSSYIAQHCPFETISSTFAKREGTKTRIQDDRDKWNSWRGPATKRNKFLRHQVTSNVTNDVRWKRSRCLFNCDDLPSIFHWIPLLNFRKYTISAFTNICLSTQILSIQNISHSSWQLRPPHCFDHEVVTRSMYRWLSSFSSRHRIYIFLYVKKIEELKTILHIKY